MVTQAAIDVLRKGGNAVDAAVAANAMQGLVEPMSNGVGGDAMIIIWEPSKSGSGAGNASGKVIGYNGSGRSPKGMSYDQLIASLRGSALIPLVGPLPVSTPGAAKAWCDMVSSHGSGKQGVAFEDLLAPAIQAARSGFPVTQVIANEWYETAISLIANNDTITSHGQHPAALDGFMLTYTIPDQVQDAAAAAKSKAPVLAMADDVIVVS